MLPTPDPRVIYEPVGDGAVLFHPESEVYFGLTSVAALVWEGLAADGASLEGVCAQVTERYPDVAPATVRADVEELVSQLASHGLLRAAR